MTTPHFVIDLGDPLFRTERVFDPAFAQNYPGLLVWHYFREFARAAGWDCVTREVAEQGVRAGTLRASQLHLVTTEWPDPYFSELIAAGAKRALAVSFESPQYVPGLYARMRELLAAYPAAYCLMRERASGARLKNAYYPAYDESVLKALPALVPWEKRRPVVAVMANKFEWERTLGDRLLTAFYALCDEGPAALIKKIGHVLRQKRSKLSTSVDQGDATETRPALPGRSLKAERLQAIWELGHTGVLDLFGQGWDRRGTIPPHSQRKWVEFLKQLGPRPLAWDQKTPTLSNYRFSVCFENYASPGYLTEKIIDCFVAGTIPIYLGDPLVAERIPPECFAAFDGKDWPGLVRRIQTMTAQEGMQIIEAGRAFLSSPEGRKYSYQAVAREMVGIGVGG